MIYKENGAFHLYPLEARFTHNGHERQEFRRDEAQLLQYAKLSNVSNFVIHSARLSDEQQARLDTLNTYDISNVSDGAARIFVEVGYAVPGHIPDTLYANYKEQILDYKRAKLREAAVEQYHKGLAAGFEDANGIRWAMTPEARARVMEITQRVQEYRSGEATSILPGNKLRVRLWDANNQRHYLTPEQVVKLAELGVDIKEQFEDRLDALLDEIDAADSHEALKAIDVTSNWPN